jgi:hypothetical protein
MRIYIYIIYTLFSISCIGSKKVNNNGFLSNPIDSNFSKFEIDTVWSIGEISLTGFFLRIEHNNGRELELFVSSKSHTINLNKIVKIIEKSNDPSIWPFFYCPTGRLDINTIIQDGKSYDYFFLETIFSQNKITFDKEKIGSYLVSYFYTDRAEFCIASCSTRELNLYNKIRKLEDGPHLISSKFPNYFFNEKARRINILLPKSTFCK